MSNEDLVDLARRHGTDKEGVHFYSRHYQRHFSSFRHSKIKLLEIGVGGYERPDFGGHSLRMWKEFFPYAEIYAIDCFDKKALEEQRIRIFQGSQDDPVFLRRVVDEAGSFDIVIDDGSHVTHHVVASFQFLFPLLKRGGIYAIEDLQTSYWPSMGGSSVDLGSVTSSMGYLKSLVDGLNFAEIDRPGIPPNYFDENIVGMHFYHNLCFIEKGDNDEPSNVLKHNVLPANFGGRSGADNAVVDEKPSTAK